MKRREFSKLLAIFPFFGLYVTASEYNPYFVIESKAKKEFFFVSQSKYRSFLVNITDYKRFAKYRNYNIKFYNYTGDISKVKFETFEI